MRPKGPTADLHLLSKATSHLRFFWGGFSLLFQLLASENFPSRRGFGTVFVSFVLL